MIEVWIRGEYEEHGRFLCHWPDVTTLDDVLPTIGRWGVNFEDRVYFQGDMSAQIEVNGTKAYFEILLSDDGSES